MAKVNMKVAENHIPDHKIESQKAIQKVEVALEQIRYANLLLYGAWSGIAILLVTFTLYMTGLLAPYIAPSRMSEYWGMRAKDYLHVAHVPSGWAWLKMTGYGDFINYIGIALLALLTVGGYLILLPAYLKKKDMPYAIIAAAEIVVLLLAASGILASGH